MYWAYAVLMNFRRSICTNPDISPVRVPKPPLENFGWVPSRPRFNLTPFLPALSLKYGRSKESEK